MKTLFIKMSFIYLVFQKEILRKMREGNINSTFACLKTDCDNEQMPPGHRKECELQNIWRWKEPGDVWQEAGAGRQLAKELH